MIGGFTVVFGGTKGGVPIFGLFTTEVIGGLTTGETGGLTTGGLGVPGITGGLTTGGLGVPGITGGLTTGVFVPPVILSITAFVVAPNAAPVNAVPNLLVVPVDFVTVGFAVGVTCVFVAGVVGVLDIAGFVAVVFDVSAGFVATVGLVVGLAAATGLVVVVLGVTEGLATEVAGFIPVGLVDTPARVPPRLVRGVNASAVVDVIGRDVTPPRDGCLLPPPKGAPSPSTIEVNGRPVDKLPRSRTPLGLRISRPRSPASKFTKGS
jgi:hypothetical protein